MFYMYYLIKFPQKIGTTITHTIELQKHKQKRDEVTWVKSGRAAIEIQMVQF